MSEVNWDHNRQAQDNILDSIGRTPVVRLQRVSADVSADIADIYAKLEYFSPSGSLKDRIYKAMITEAEKRGNLRPEMIRIRSVSSTATRRTGLSLTSASHLLG